MRIVRNAVSPYLCTRNKKRKEIMRKIIFLAVYMAAGLSATYADNIDIHANDTTKVIDIDEVTIVATPKETSKLRSLPLSSTIMNHEVMQQKGITGIHDLTSVVPSLYIPDYGS